MKTRILILLLLCISVFVTYAQNQTHSHADSTNTELVKNNKEKHRILLVEGLIQMNEGKWYDAEGKVMVSITLEDSVLRAIHIRTSLSFLSRNVDQEILEINKDSLTHISLGKIVDGLISINLMPGFSTEGGVVELSVSLLSKNYPVKEYIYISRNSDGEFQAYKTEKRSGNEIESLKIFLKGRIINYKDIIPVGYIISQKENLSNN